VARAERLAGRGDHDRARGLVRRDGVELALERREHAFAQRVERLRPVERERDDAARVDVPPDEGSEVGGDAVVHGEALSIVYSIAAAERARSRSWNFWILPVEVLGIASKRISRGTL
jgi:hypothetical protein